MSYVIVEQEKQDVGVFLCKIQGYGLNTGGFISTIQ